MPHSTSTPLTRREALARAALAMGGAMAASSLSVGRTAPAPGPQPSEFVFCLNTGTIRGQKLGIVKEIEVAAKAGYQAIEPWVEALEQYAKAGGSLKDLAARLKDSGLTMESAIGFPQWVVDDDARRAKGMERAKYEMDLIVQAGGKRLAAPPAGATDTPGLDLGKAAERYRALLEAGDQIGVTPMLEVWGFSKNLNRLSVCACVALDTGHPKAAVLADIFHMYKGGSPFEGLRLLGGPALPVFHMNDYPATPSREEVNDGYRLFPGDGVAPMDQILRNLHAGGGRKVLSLELFNRKYYEMDALTAVKEGLEKTQAAVKRALG
jgi:sugar phosphate isomerase/epimerase